MMASLNLTEDERHALGALLRLIESSRGTTPTNIKKRLLRIERLAIAVRPLKPKLENEPCRPSI